MSYHEWNRLMLAFAAAPTVELARALRAGVESSAGDDETAHSREDELRDVVLAHIAAGGDFARELAAIASSTSTLEFSRWCA